MKLVQMPRDLLTVEQDDLPMLGVHPVLIEAVGARCVGDPLAIPSLALLGPGSAGTTAALMVLARRVGAALRDENIRLRDRGGNLRRGRQKLCYLPGSSLAAVLGTEQGKRALESEAVVFLQDLEGAWADSASSHLGADAVAALIALRARSGLRTYVSADPATLPVALREALLADLDRAVVDAPI